MTGNDLFDFPVTIKRTGRRKTVAIRIVEGTVQVAAPMRLSEKRITTLIAQKEKWIRKKLVEDAERPKMRPRQFVNGESFFYLGNQHKLELMPGARGVVQFNCGRLDLSVPGTLEGESGKRYVKRQLTRWYREKATESLDVKTDTFSAHLGVQPNHVEVKYFKSRWGSCSRDGTIKYNWRVIMAPHHVIDYLVVHELAHLVHHNHSPEYWKVVESCLPDYRESRRWLKEYGATLSLDQAVVQSVKNS